MTPLEHQAKIKAQILGSYSNAPQLQILKSEETKPISEEKKEVEGIEESKKEGE